jgi:hypothetical protein
MSDLVLEFGFFHLSRRENIICLQVLGLSPFLMFVAMLNATCGIFGLLIDLRLFWLSYD